MAWYETKKGGTARITEKTATGEIATFTTVIGGLPLKSCAVGIQGYQSGTGDPSPSNVRPISGWSSVGVTRAGKNLINWKVSATTFEFLLPSGSYVLSSNGTLATGLWYFRGYDADGNLYTSKDALGLGSAWTHSSSSHWNYAQGTATFAFTVPSGCSKLEIFKQNADGTIDCQIELGSTATSFEQYQGVTVTIALGQTVYGGSLDVTRGVLTVTHGRVKLEDLTWYRTTNYSHPVWYAQIPDRLFSSTSSVSAEAFRNIGIIGSASQFANASVDFDIACSSGNLQIFVRYDSVETSADFIASVGNTYILYELATPVTVQLSPTEVRTLLGTNNVWSNTGDVSLVAYDGDVENLDHLRDTYEDMRRPDVPALISGNTLFSYEDIMSDSTVIPQNMFNGCTSIENVYSADVLTVGASAFAGATKLKYISLPNCTQVGAAAFSCQRTVSADKAYVKIDLPKCTTMGTRAFYKFGATDATAELEFPELTQIGSDCFSADGASTAFTIKSIKLPKLAEAGSTAFQRMTAETIDIGSSCTQLNTTPLAYATVTNFICRAITPPALGSSAGLGGTNMTLTNIYVPDAALSDYTDNTNYPRWAKHSALMHPLSDIEPTT